MRWVLRLVETETDSLGGGVDVMVISRSRDLGDIADLGLTLPEGKQLLARVQQAVVTAQAHGHVVLRPNCLSCGGGCHIKDWRLHQVATLFGTVAVRLPRFRCASCGHSTTCISWPSHCRSTPELDQLRAHLSALMPYRVAAGVLTHLLPVDAGKSPETLRGHTLKIGEHLREAPAVKPATAASAITVTVDFDLHPQLPGRRTASGGSRRQRRDIRRRPAGIRRCCEDRYGHRGTDPPQPRDGRPNCRHRVDRVYRWLSGPAFDFGRGRRHEATDRRLVPHRHAAGACEAGGERIVHRRAGSGPGEDGDRRGGRAPALADLER